jgi:spore germination cell wall hydrolase CwlJ-like protein
MYFEVNRASEDGLLAVGTVVMNRVASPGYPHSICGVVGQPGQFADGVLSAPMRPQEQQDVERVADAILAGKRHPGLDKTLFFHRAGLTFSYPNMHYVLVAGGDAFYEKRRRHDRVSSLVDDRGALEAR